MIPFKPKPLALIISLTLSAPWVLAQQSTDVGQINVEGQGGGTSSGLIAAEESTKARSSVNRLHLENIAPASNAYQTLDLLPGINTFSYDATGMFGGGLRIRGFNSDQLGFTINGAPVNDSGNFAVYPQEYTDNENICEVYVTQGSTDINAPHVGASGGNVGMVSCAPDDKAGVKTAGSVGDLNFKRGFVRADSGLVGNKKFKTYISLSDANVDKFKGSGGAQRTHIDWGMSMQPTDNITLSSNLLYNNALNNNFRTLTLAQIATSGRNLDFSASAPQHLSPVANTAQTESTPSDGFYKYNINPFRNALFTGKIDYKVDTNLNFSAEPYYWYGYGTGGGQLTTVTEGGTGTNATRVRDVNGDGDTLDKVMVYGSNVTETRRPGVTLKANYLLDNHLINGGLWFESAKHVQTAPRVSFGNDGNSSCVWLNSCGTYVLNENGNIFQNRNQMTINNASSLFLQDSIALMKEKLHVVVGIRQSRINRDFFNYANANSTSTTGRSDADYEIQQTYSHLLPSAGVKYDLDTSSSVFSNVAQNFRVPSNFVFQNLLQGGTVQNGVLTGATLRIPVVTPETSVNWDLGYRYHSDKTTLSGSLFYTNFQNRIASSYDPASTLSIDYNVGSSTMKGAEFEAGHKLNSNFTVYSSLSYINSVMNQNLQTSSTNIEQTSGKQFPDTPNWLAALAVGYQQGQFFSLATAKYTGRAYSTLVNDEAMPGYMTYNLALGYKLLGNTFFKNPKIKFNVSNLFNNNYLRISSPSGSSFTVRSLGTGGSAPSYYVGAPRFSALTLSSEF